MPALNFIRSNLYKVIALFLFVFTSFVYSQQQQGQEGDDFSASLLDLVSNKELSNKTKFVKAIEYFRASGSFDDSKGMLNQSALQEQQAIFLKYLDQAPSYALSGNRGSLKSFISQSVNWASDEALSHAARNMRALYLSAVFNRAALSISEADYPYTLSTFNILSHQPASFPCEILKQHPNVSLDAFSDLSDEFSKTIYDFLGLRKRLAFDCPVVFKRFMNIETTDYVDAFELANGRGVDRLFVNEPDDNDQKSSGKEDIVFPEFDQELLIGKLKASEKSDDRLLLALMLHVFAHEQQKEIAEILHALKVELFHEPLSDYVKEVLGGDGISIDRSYDGSDQSMLSYLVTLSMRLTPGFSIPCGLLIESPYFLAAEKPRFYSTMDVSLPRPDCILKNYPLPHSVSEFMSSAYVPQGNWLSSHQGSMRHAHYINDKLAQKKLHLFPQKIRSVPINEGQYPYESWSLLNLSNRKIFNSLTKQYVMALSDLSDHYQRYFSMAATEADRAAKYALWNVVVEGHWGPTERKGLRYLILSGASDDEIKELLSHVDDLADIEHTQIAMRYYGGYWFELGKPDSLLMVSVNRPAIVSMLLQKKNSGSFNQGSSLFRNNPITDVNYANRIGKTALHVAVEENNLASVQLLLKAGADINAVVSNSKLKHSDRTIAMYAAANADLELVRFLKQVGVSFDVQDSKGLTPLSYLLGHQYLERNPHLTADNLKDFVATIAPAVLEDSGQNISPRFDCGKASSFVEKRLCENPKLGALDRQVTTGYIRARKGEGADLVKKDQLIWLKQRNKCRDDTCIAQRYEERLSLLH